MLWTRGGASAIAIAPDGAIYASTQDALEKLSPTGEVLWQLASAATPASASDAFVYAVRTTQGRFGPLPTYVRIPADGADEAVIGSGTDLTGRRIFASPEDDQVAIAFDPRSTTLTFQGHDGSAWSVPGGDEGAFFGSAAFTAGGIVVSGQTANAATVLGQAVPAHTAFLLGLDRSGQLAWLQLLGSGSWHGLAAAADGTVFALATLDADAQWGGSALAAGDNLLLSLSSEHSPAGAQVLEAGPPGLLAAAPSGEVAVMEPFTPDACGAAVRIRTFDAQLTARSERTLRPADCANGSLEPIAMGFSNGHLVADVHALGAVDLGDQTVAAGPDGYLLVAFR